MEGHQGGTGVLESAGWVVKRSKTTSINAIGVDSVARQILNLLPTSNGSKSITPLSPWSSHPLHPPVPPIDAPVEQIDALLDWIFIVSVLNFSFWSDKTEKERYAIEWRGERRKGYWSLLAALHRALGDGIPITAPDFYANISIDEASSIFRSDTSEPIPLLEERVRVMREAGSLLCERYEGHFRLMLEAANGSAVELVRLVVDGLSSFRDEAACDGRTVKFYKRAQILVAETWAAFEGRGPGRFDHIGELTMFADYRVPQILHSLGTITYSSELTALLRSHANLQNGSSEEVELRAASIVAVERIGSRIAALIAAEETSRRAPTAVELDFWLWDMAKEEERKAREEGRELLPHHRTRSCFY